MEFKVKRFDSLTAKEVYEILKLRAKIFVTEQHCLYLDMDDIDYDSIHVFAEEGDGIVIACLRVFLTDPETAHIGRVATLRHGEGAGGALLKRGIRAVREEMNVKRIVLDAQTYATGYYAREGFQVISGEHEIDGMPHRTMELVL